MSSLEHVLRVSGATARQLDHWVRTGYLHPDGPGGTGNSFHWPAAEIRAAVVMARLVEAGVKPAAAAQAARDGCKELAAVLAALEQRGLLQVAAGVARSAAGGD